MECRPVFRKSGPSDMNSCFPLDQPMDYHSLLSLGRVGTT